MILTFDMIILIRDKSKIRTGDPVVFVRELGSRRILTTDGGPSRVAGPATEYGRLYFDAGDRPCVVPHRERDYEADKWIAKDWAE